MTLSQEALIAVEELNAELNSAIINPDAVPGPFSFETEGFPHGRVSFMGACIWTEDDDDRGWITDDNGDIAGRPSLKSFFLGCAHRITTELSEKLKRLIVES